jgi:hypothetical protein
MNDTNTSQWKYSQPTACYGATLGHLGSSNTPKCFTLLQPKTTPLRNHFYNHPLHFASATTSVIRYVTSRVTYPMFICLAQVIGSPNELYAWSPKVCTTNMSLNSVTHQSNLVSLCDQLYDKFCDELCNHPPCRSASSHHKICSWSIKGVRLDQPSTTPSTEPLS